MAAKAGPFWTLCITTGHEAKDVKLVCSPLSTAPERTSSHCIHALQDVLRILCSIAYYPSQLLASGCSLSLNQIIVASEMSGMHITAQAYTCSSDKLR